MRVFLFISCYGISWPMAQRCVEEGHRAILYINEKDCRRIANGLVEKHEIKEVLVDEEGNLDTSVLNSLLKPVPNCIYLTWSIMVMEKRQIYLEKRLPVIRRK